MFKRLVNTGLDHDLSKYEKVELGSDPRDSDAGQDDARDKTQSGHGRRDGIFSSTLVDTTKKLEFYLKNGKRGKNS